MIKQDIIEEHHINEPAPWVSNSVIAPKVDGSIRMTLDAHNVNRAIQFSLQIIPSLSPILNAANFITLIR